MGLMLPALAVYESPVDVFRGPPLKRSDELGVSDEDDVSLKNRESAASLSWEHAFRKQTAKAV